MTLFRTVEPAVEPVSPVEAKAHLRIDHDSEDTLISGLIRAARQEVEQETGLALIDQSWRLALDRWPRDGLVLLRRAPVRQILSVTVFDGDGAASVLAPESYQLDAVSSPARLHLDARPEPGLALNGIEIDFTAGFGEAGTDVPDLLKRAIMILVAYWYEFRAAFGADSQPVSLPGEYRRLIAAWRRPRL
ncbi:head-tail connector protein [Chelativorans intermedius]|uniref:Head-tail connector protein n=1 Tax=Chelativorans intermedius TaxID=515947 RepID=A0ABV6DC74_9HYPH|nr:head-tail connector protein [Chelativorans intermedius]MCT8999641.1 head-tail connector protein [Chelativorans intermedius]